MSNSDEPQADESAETTDPTHDSSVEEQQVESPTEPASEPAPDTDAATEETAAAAEEPAAGDDAASTSKGIDPKSLMDWYILKVAFNREDTVREAIEKRIKMSGMEEKFGQVLVPTEDVVEFTRSGKRKIVKRKLYPGYLMLQMEVDDDTWFLIRETTGVSDFTGTAGKPMPMDPEEVERVIKVTQPDEEDDKPMKTAIPFREGDRVRCKEGYFQNLEGDVDKVDEANGRITVIISIFGRSTPVELDHWQVEPV